jgi:poly[(R)-3-hydroxyalkanoate] polymerase subunit PhaE
MQSLPIPTNKDLDELYEELYLLKKRIRDLEKAQKDHRKS